MPYTKEQLRAYWATNKVILNQKRKEKRRLAKLGLAISEQVSHLKASQLNSEKVSHEEVSNQVKKVSQNLSEQVSHNQPLKVSHGEVSHNSPEVSQNSPKKVSQPKTANPYLTKLIKAWQTQTNHSCPPTCSHSYCANCWYFADQELVNYKGLVN